MRAFSNANAVSLILIGALTACSRDGGREPTVTRIDSAGIEIVQTTAPSWMPGDDWRIDSVPRLLIGRTEGESAYLFGDVSGAVRIGDRILVGDAQTLDIRIFGLDGIHIATVGGAGEGPGEFGSLYQFDRCEGNLAYGFDIYDQTLQVRDANGELVREFRTVEPASERPRRPYRLECSTDGTGFVAVGWGNDATNRAAMVLGTVPRNMAPVWLLDDSAQFIADLGEHLSSERFISISRATGRPGGSGPHPFGRATSFALAPDLLYVGSGESMSVNVFTRDGRLIRKLRGPSEDLAVTEALLSEYRGATLDEDGLYDRNMLESQEFPMPPSLPFYTDMRLDPDGALWVKRFAPPWEMANRWGVFGPDGGFLGHVTLPEGLTVTDLGSDWIVGVVTDDLGVDRVGLYSLIKP